MEAKRQISCEKEYTGFTINRNNALLKLTKIQHKIHLFSRMLVESYMVILVESYIYFRVIYVMESYHRLYFSIAESYVYCEFTMLYLLYSYI